MEESWSFIQGWLARVQGPMSFRLILQPLIAAYFAFRDGRKDAREGRPPFFWALFTEPGHRPELLQGVWQSVGKVFLIAIVLDLVFQFLAFKEIRSVLGALIAGGLLALLPYLLLRGPVARLFRRAPQGEKR